LLSLRGTVAEVDTGEGKTLATLLAALWAGLKGWPVHVMTANDYLALRDMEEAAPVFLAVDIPLGVVKGEQSDDERRENLAKQVIYATGKELVFEFLRDEAVLGDSRRPVDMAYSQLLGELSERPYVHGFGIALVDEADSVLIDEAATPCIVTTPAKTFWRESDLKEALSFAQSLISGKDYQLYKSQRQIQLLDLGLDKIFALQWGGRLTNHVYRQAVIELALKAIHFFHRDQDYVVQDDKVVIVDQLTGRLMPERRWESGLHELIEVSEDVPMSGGQKITGSMTFQRFFQKYSLIGGMTGTAREIAPELRSVYQVTVERVQRRFTLLRENAGFSLLSSEEEVKQAFVDSVKRYQAAGRAVLVGSRSIEHSQQLSHWLSEAGVESCLLNGIQDEEESELIGRAGEAGRITIATSIAGRGTDIKLDETVKKAGGLHVLIMDNLPSARMTRQLIGRSARQQDPGSFEIMLDLNYLQEHDELLKHLPFQITSSLIKRVLPISQWLYEHKKRKQRKMLQKNMTEKSKWLVFGKNY